MEEVLVPRSQIIFGKLVYWITVIAASICVIGPFIAFINMDGNVINPHYEMQNIFDGMRSDFEDQDLQADVSKGTRWLAVEDAGKFDDPEKTDHDVQVRIISSNGNGELENIVAIDTTRNMIEVSDNLLNSYSAEQTKVAEVTIWDARGAVSIKTDALASQDRLQLASVDRIDDPTAEHPVAIMIQDNTSREEVLLKSVDRQNNILWLAHPLDNSYSVADEAKVIEVTAADEVKGGHFWLHNFTNGDGVTQFGLVLGCAVGIPAMIGAALFFAFKERSIGWASGAVLIAALIAIPALGLVNI